MLCKVLLVLKQRLLLQQPTPVMPLQLLLLQQPLLQRHPLLSQPLHLPLLVLPLQLQLLLLKTDTTSSHSRRVGLLPYRLHPLHIHLLCCNPLSVV
jgi:hypothetical protein